MLQAATRHSKNPLTDFGSALKSSRRITKLSLLEAATRAGVSPNNWQSFEQNKFGPGSRKNWDESTPRQRSGWIRTATRVLKYYKKSFNCEQQIQLDLDAIICDLNELFIFPEGEEDRGIILRTLSESLEVLGTIPHDSAWAALNRGNLTVGLSTWRPFGLSVRIENTQADAKFSEDARQAETYRLLLSILGFLHSDFGEKALKTQTLYDLPQAMQSLSDNKETRGAPNIIFGIYDTPRRRMNGLEFVNLPGIAFGLGVLLNADNATFEPIKFLENLTNPDAVQETHIVVINADIGYDFICGQCRMEPGENLSVLSLDLGIKNNAKELFSIINRTKSENNKKAYLIGDVMLCDSLRQELILYNYKSMVKALVQDPYPLPIYKAGFVLRADDPLVRLLQECLYGTFFDSFSYVLATQYAKLIQTSMYLNSSVQHIRLRELEGLTVRQKTQFKLAVMNALKGRLDGEYMIKIEEQITAIW